MTTLLFDILLPAAGAALSLGGSVLLERRGCAGLPVQIEKPKLLEKIFKPRADAPYVPFITLPKTRILLVILAAVLAVVFLVSDALIDGFTGGKYGLPLTALLLISLFCPLSLLLRSYQPGRKSRALWHGAWWLMLCFVLEIGLFNAKSFTTDYHQYTVDLTSVEILSPDTVTYDDVKSSLAFTRDGQIVLYDLPEDTRALSLTFNRKGRGHKSNVQIGMRDENVTADYTYIGSKLTAMDPGSPVRFTLAPYGKISALKISVSETDGEFILKKAVTSSALPFAFLMRRFLLLFLTGLGLIFIRQYGWSKTVYDRTKRSHRLLVVGAVLVSLLPVLVIYAPVDNRDLAFPEYTEDMNVEYYDIHIQLYDALRHGQTNLRIPSDERLLEMENPYSNTARSEYGANAVWDHCWYQGKYYSYFGIVPVLLFYFPFVAITGKLPPLQISIDFFAVLGSVFFCLTILAAVRLFVKKPNLLLLLLSLVCSSACADIIQTMHFTNMYNLPFAAGICFLFLCLWLGMRACFTGGVVPRFLLLCGSGLAMAMCAGSRPSLAISCLLLTPLFIWLLCRKNDRVGVKIGEAAAFLLPLLAGVGGLMLYNHARFGSYTDFGAAYQMTVSDINANKLELHLLPFGLFYYLALPPSLMHRFPFMGLTSYNLDNLTHYFYLDASVGALYMPMLLMAVLLLPGALRRRKTAGLVSSTPSAVYRGFALCAFGLVCMVSWMDFCLAGVNIRYQMDILGIFSLLAIVLILMAGQKSVRLRRLAVLAIPCSAIQAWFWILNELGGNLTESRPLLYEMIEELVIFWQ